jgi:hypothetical protein
MPGEARVGIGAEEEEGGVLMWETGGKRIK